MLVSLIVSTWNRPALLKQFFESLEEHAHYPCEIIVHDDGSGLVTTSYLSQLLRDGRISTLILNPENHNRGHGTAVNRAANMAEGEYIVKLNGDEVFADNWLETAVNTMEAYPEVVLLHLAHYLHSQHWPERVEDLPWDIEPYTIHRETRNGIPIRVVWVGPGCAFMIRKKTWIEQGPWLNGYDPHFTEDMEYRLRLAPMMRLLSEGSHSPPKDLNAHWEQYKDTPWLGLTDPPVVSYHKGHGLCSIGDAQKTLKKGPYICLSSL